MASRLVVCIDGTWNGTTPSGEPARSPTNVERISRLLRHDTAQRIIYRPGVGTTGKFSRFAGGVWGAGSNQLIRNAYRFLCEHYEPGDRIALFGFSRGAFAVRSVVGVLARVGMLRREHLEHVHEAVSLYNRPLWMGTAKLYSFKKEYCHPERIAIDFIGVWDTVIRYGPILGPMRAILSSVLKRHFGLFDQKIPLSVKKFCHALALDEDRAAFWPWRAAFNENLQEQIEEMWFAGSHSDVGGGNGDLCLTDFSLQWMAEHAAKAGLEFRQMPSVNTPDDLRSVHTTPSRIGFWRLLPFRRRIVEDDDKFHPSVEQLARAGGYRPTAKLPGKAPQLSLNN